MTFMPPSPFIFNSVDVVMPSADAAAALTTSPTVAAAVPYSAGEMLPPVDQAAASAHRAHPAHPAHPAHAAAVPFSGAFDPEAWTAEDEERYQRFKRAVGELDDPPLFLRQYRKLR